MRLKIFHSLLLKETLLLFRAQNGLISMVSLILSFLYIFHFVFEKDFFLERNTIAGIRWSLLYLLSFIYISQSSWEEREGGADRIGSGMISGTYIYLAKTVSSFFALTLSSLVLNFACLFLFEKSSISFNEFIMQYSLLVPGMLSVAAIGVCISRISEATRLKEIIIPVLQIPLSLPPLLFGMNAERKMLASGKIPLEGFFVVLSFSIFYLTLGTLAEEILGGKD